MGRSGKGACFSELAGGCRTWVEDENNCFAQLWLCALVNAVFNVTVSV